MESGFFCLLCVVVWSTPTAADDGDLDITLGGYFQPNFVWVSNSAFNDDDHDGFESANARLTGRGQVAWL